MHIFCVYVGCLEEYVKDLGEWMKASSRHLNKPTMTVTMTVTVTVTVTVTRLATDCTAFFFFFIKYLIY
jgi:hypothetical protein